MKETDLKETMKSTNIFYIHGYGSSAQSETGTELRKVYPGLHALEYDHSDPKTAIAKLAGEINSYRGEIIVIGSSLGAWYTEQLTKLVSGTFILFNPATEPEVTLKTLGVPDFICDRYEAESDYTFIRDYGRFVILAKDDELIPYKIAFNKYKEVADIKTTKGGHRATLNNIDLIIETIRKIENKLC